MTGGDGVLNVASTPIPTEDSLLDEAGSSRLEYHSEEEEGSFFGGMSAPVCFGSPSLNFRMWCSHSCVLVRVCVCVCVFVSQRR